jgi:hypothetical protein
MAAETRALLRLARMVCVTALNAAAATPPHLRRLAKAAWQLLRAFLAFGTPLAKTRAVRRLLTKPMFLPLLLQTPHAGEEYYIQQNSHALSRSFCLSKQEFYHQLTCEWGRRGASVPVGWRAAGAASAAGSI